MDTQRHDITDQVPELLGKQQAQATTNSADYARQKRLDYALDPSGLIVKKEYLINPENKAIEAEESRAFLEEYNR